MRLSKLLVFLTALLVPLILLVSQGCSPLGTSPPSAEEDQARARLASLKQQLAELQEDLARAKAEQALEAPRSARHGHAWRPLAPNAVPPEGFALYSYLLLTAESSEQLSSALLTLIDSLPERQDLIPAERNLILLPSVGAANDPLSLANYRYADAAALLAPYRTLFQQPSGPFLVLSGRPLPAPAEQVVILDLAERNPPFLKQILTRLQQRQVPDQSFPRSRQARQLLDLVDLSATAPLHLVGSESALVISWAR